MNNTKAYILGFMIFAFGMFLGSKWSPDYLEFCTDGSGFLVFVVFGICLFVGISLSDLYFKKKKEKGAKDD